MTMLIMADSEEYALLSLEWCRKLGIDPFCPNVLLKPQEMRIWFLRAFVTERHTHQSHARGREMICEKFGVEDAAIDPWVQLNNTCGKAYNKLSSLLNPQNAPGVAITLQNVCEAPQSQPFPMYAADHILVGCTYTVKHVVEAYRQAVASQL